MCRQRVWREEQEREKKRRERLSGTSSTTSIHLSDSAGVPAPALPSSTAVELIDIVVASHEPASESSAQEATAHIQIDLDANIPVASDADAEKTSQRGDSNEAEHGATLDSSSASSAALPAESVPPTGTDAPAK